MKSILTLALALALCAVGHADQQSAAAASTSADEAAVLKLERAWPDAIVKRDTVTMLSMGTADGMVVAPAGELVTLKQLMDDVKSGALTVESMHIDDLQVHVYGHTAVVYGLETEKSKYKGEDTSGQYRFADTWLKQNGRWLCVVTVSVRVASAKKP